MIVLASINCICSPNKLSCRYVKVKTDLKSKAPVRLRHSVVSIFIAATASWQRAYGAFPASGKVFVTASIFIIVNINTIRRYFASALRTARCRPAVSTLEVRGRLNYTSREPCTGHLL